MAVSESIEFALVGARIFTGEKFVEHSAVLVKNGQVASIVPANVIPKNVLQVAVSGLLAPGFIDVQVNGGGGVLFNDNVTVDGIKTIAAAHRRFGTTGLLPTYISADQAGMQQAIKAVDSAITQQVPGVLGIHLEGPYLNPDKSGIHNKAAICSLDDSAIGLVASLKQGRTLLTLAPEMLADGMIKKLVEHDIIISAGHTAASYAQMHSAIAEGLTGFTHLFNAMQSIQAREPGVVGAALMDETTWCGFIADGYHVSIANLNLALRCKAKGKMLLVTDAMPPVGTDISSFTIDNEEIFVNEGRCTNAAGVLAGSCLDMATAVRNTVNLLDIDLDEALRMASLYPADFLGASNHYGLIKTGYAADFVLLDDDLQVSNTWISGVVNEP